MKNLFELGSKYSRHIISDSLNDTDNFPIPSDKLEEIVKRIKISREGIVHVRELNSYLLFVDLVKGDKEKRFHFNEYFENDYFHWESQTTQKQDDQQILDLISKKYDILLFVRIDQKVKSITQQFTYCGQVQYITHDSKSNYPVRVDLLSLEYDKSTKNDSLKDIYEWKPEDSGKTTLNKTNYSSGKKRTNYSKPGKTERRGLVTSRVGQGWYRQEVLKKWDYKCGVTGSDIIKILISSHIVPWKDSDDEEKLDSDNGILLSPDLDGLFDKYLISFDDSGEILISNKLTEEELKLLGINKNMRL
ncbi:MAG: hypothetical protein CBD58_02155, partial [bacterium TMED198]